MNKTEATTFLNNNIRDLQDGSIKKVGHNRFSFISGSSEGLLYHSTVVAIVCNGVVTLNTGGWRTATTKRTLELLGRGDYLDGNRARFNLYQDAHRWFISTVVGTWQWSDSLATIDADGNVTGSAVTRV